MPISKTVITTMSQSGYGQYGKRMIETFDKHWPQSIKLKIYYEWLPYNYQKNLSDRIVKGNSIVELFSKKDIDYHFITVSVSI